MSKMSQIHQEIVDMLDEGYRPVVISSILHIPLNMVYDVLEQLEQTEDYSPFETVNS